MKTKIKRSTDLNNFFNWFFLEIMVYPKTYTYIKVLESWWPAPALDSFSFYIKFFFKLNSQFFYKQYLHLFIFRPSASIVHYKFIAFTAVLKIIKKLRLPLVILSNLSSSTKIYTVKKICVP